ncbi:MAG TPA: acyl-CoA dehydrogenase family protein, partial [Pseudonocardiaceae bacterium]
TPVYDRENRFFTEDWEELKQSGYLLCTVDKKFGGGGLGLDEYLKLVRRLAYVAPATALATNMHCYWTGVASDLLKMGDTSCQWILELAAKGEIFAALHGEPGNDVPVFLAVATANRAKGGWEISGHKIFGSLTPVWTYGGFHAADNSDPDHPRIVHGFVHRNEPGVQIVDTWDTIGMRATQSQDTVLDKAFVPDEHVPLVCPAGMAGAGPFHLALFAWALLGFSASYLGAAKRAFDMIVEQLPKRASIALPSGSMAHHPEVQHQVAEMRVAYDAAEALLEATARDWAAGVQHEDWPIRMMSARLFVINQSFKIVEKAFELTGGAGAFKRHRLEQIYRDVSMGRFHPGNRLLTPEVIGKLTLGIDPDATPRWG